MRFVHPRTVDFGGQHDGENDMARHALDGILSVAKRCTILGTTLGGAAALLLVGCGPDKTPSNAKLIKGLNAYYVAHDDCLYQSAIRFPYTVSATDKSEDGAKKMDALEAAGLLTKSEERSLKENRYSQTPYGVRAGGRFCYGHRVISSVDGFTPPVVEKGYRRTQVTYHYTLVNVPTWAKADKVMKAFPEMAKTTSGPSQGSDKMTLTYNGWEIAP
jgi:hypothetical protein